MRLQKVTGTPFTITCVACGRKTTAGDTFTVYADLDGEPFKAYYCQGCGTPCTREGCGHLSSEHEHGNGPCNWKAVPYTHHCVCYQFKTGK